MSWTPFERQVLSVIYRNGQTLRELRYEYLEQDWLRGQDLPEMPRLQTLELGNFKLTKDRLRKFILAKCPKLETLGLVCVKVFPKDTVVPPRGRPDLDQFVRAQSHSIVRDGEGRPRTGDVRLISSGAKQQQCQQRQKTNSGKSNVTSHSTPRTSKDDQYVRGVKRYLVYDKVYAVLDLFPDLESIVFRPEKPFHTVWDWPPTSEYEGMIKSTCHNLHSLTVETFPPHQETWGRLIRSISQLTHLSLEGIAEYDRMIVGEAIQYHFPMVESVHVGTSMTNPAIVLQFLEKCPRLQRWSCSENVAISATSLKMSLLRVDRKTRWVCEEMREMIWPKNVAGFGPQEIDRLVASLQNKSSTLRIESPLELPAIETPGGLRDQEEKNKGVNVSRMQKDSETESRERIFKLLLSALESMKYLKCISFGSQMHRIK
ncbi:hypothetical protein BGZ79_004030 [Entomortierella chlamydospora]|nr:hypothetical protein BGZ79_004030 [Entomortierella chlamydospora]